MTEVQHGAIGETRRSLEDARVSAVEAPRRACDFVCRNDLLRECFPDARLPDTGGLAKLFERGAVESRDWNLTPGCYAGVEPEERDEDFDFEEALRSVYIDIDMLNEDAATLVAPIARNREEIGT